MQVFFAFYITFFILYYQWAIYILQNLDNKSFYNKLFFKVSIQYLIGILIIMSIFVYFLVYINETQTRRTNTLSWLNLQIQKIKTHPNIYLIDLEKAKKEKKGEIEDVVARSIVKELNDQGMYKQYEEAKEKDASKQYKEFKAELELVENQEEYKESRAALVKSQEEELGNIADLIEY